MPQVHNSHRAPFFFIVLFAISFLTYLLIHPFINSLLISLVLATLLNPLYRIILNKTNQKPLISTIITVILSLLIVLIPLIIVLTSLSYQIANLQQIFSKNYNPSSLNQIINQLNQTIEKIPFINYQFSPTSLLTTTQSLAKSLGNWFFSSAVSLTNSTASFITNLLIVIVTTISLLPNLDQIKRYIVRLSPLEKSVTQQYLKTSRIVMSNMIKGTFLIAIIQASLAGLLLWYLNVSSALLLTTIMAILAIIPYAGTALIMLPTALIFYANNQPQTALLIIGYQILVVSTIDNLLRPMLISSQAKLHPAIMLIAILGGIHLFGPFLGLIYGPLVAILFITSLQIYQKNYSPFATKK